MSTEDTGSLEDRLQRLGIAHDVQRLMATGIGKLPLSETAKESLTSKSATAVVVVGETGVALVKGATSAAKEGAETFQRTRHAHGTPTDEPAAPAPAPDVTTRLERLSALHRDGHLDDAEYAAAKARVLAEG
ncbi:SHOCT domain-containing protein [Cellulomonas humilata]|uniref:SHOCT domain-containing protein n=1 Tax=Cellulomonas humilata TaxID=144055 RepID=A0A7Y5ZY58_9CELL|nr:SHOCT domain-containing protein [Cellulomonas humilata]NUU16301.1 SHOCT domain-containing protein [Cellulomonas humilata]